MLAIFKREFKNFFRAPIVFFALFLIFLLHLIGLDKSVCDWCGGFSVSIPCLAACFGVSLISSEFAKNKTYKLLFSSPVSMTAIVLGKYFALVAFFLAVSSISVFIVLLIHFCFGVSIDDGYLFFGFLSLIFRIMVGAAVVEFISTWSSKSAILSGIVFLGWIFLVSMIGFAFDSFAFFRRFNIFTEIYATCFYPEQHAFRLSCGVIGFKTIIYFISMIVGFLYLTKKFLESKRFV